MAESGPEPGAQPFLTLPDYLVQCLRLVFVGINPGTYSARRGHYFARPANRFWPGFSRSRLSAPVRAALGRDILLPEDDARLLSFGIGFTDVVKMATAKASVLRPDDFERWAPQLVEKLALYRPAAACFHGVTGYRSLLRYGLGRTEKGAVLGEQRERIGATHVFVVPNPCPANAHFRPAAQVAWYDRLADFMVSYGVGGMLFPVP